MFFALWWAISSLACTKTQFCSTSSSEILRTCWKVAVRAILPAHQVLLPIVLRYAVIVSMYLSLSQVKERRLAKAPITIPCPNRPGIHTCSPQGVCSMRLITMTCSGDSSCWGTQCTAFLHLCCSFIIQYISCQNNITSSDNTCPGSVGCWNETNSSCLSQWALAASSRVVHQPLSRMGRSYTVLRSQETGVTPRQVGGSGNVELLRIVGNGWLRRSGTDNVQSGIYTLRGGGISLTWAQVRCEMLAVPETVLISMFIDVWLFLCGVESEVVVCVCW